MSACRWSAASMLTPKRYLAGPCRTRPTRARLYAGPVPLPVAEGFITSARTAADLVTRPEVRDRWELESSCAGMTNGGLANHLADQAANTVRLLAADPSELAPIPVVEH